MHGKTIFLLIVLLVILLIGGSSLFVVREGQQALLTRLGKIEKNPQGEPQVYLPGLHVKLPIVSSTLYFDTRIQTLDTEKSRIVTAQQKDVNVDYYVKWRIVDLAKYYTATGGLNIQAEQLLSQQVNNALRAEFGKRTIPEVVSDDRSAIMNALRTAADKSAKPLGIDIVDVRIKTIDLPDEVSTAVYSRMRAERERVAAEHRAEGRSKSEAIKANADADVVVITANAKQQAATVKAKGDAKAAAIYAKAYGKNPSFYAFYQSLDAYRHTLAQQNNMLVLSPNSEFFKYFNQANGTKHSK
tara:strand:- start:45995 stop:46894 length:900 start_codon:yes stop_codon:yes gene_type:complete